MVHVLSKEGKPLMPTQRHGKVKHLLKDRKARIVNYKPFTIQLLYESTNYVQPLYGGTDTGRTNIGNTVIDDAGNVKYADHVETRNKEVVKNMSDRRMHRQASRRGNRQKKKRRATKVDKHQKKVEIRKFLSGKKGPVTQKVIGGDESKFDNRVRKPYGNNKVWLTPSANQLVQTHINMIKKICSIVPVGEWTIEMPKFAFMKMEDGTVKGVDFQNGRLKGYASVNEYVYARQDGKSYFSDAPIEHYHHIVPRCKGGSNDPDNIIGVTKAEHEAIHKGELEVNVEGFRKKYQATSVLNQATWEIYHQLCEMFGKENVHVTFGYKTKQYYEDHNIKKSHTNDAYCIACIGSNVNGTTPPDDNYYEVKQFKRHDRSIICAQKERTYKLDGKTVCKNRNKRIGQDKVPSLAEYRQEHPNDVGRLTVIKSKRSYNNVHRNLPGMVFLHKGKRYVLRGVANQSTKYYPVDGLDSKQYLKAKECAIVQKNRGLVYL